MKLVKLLKKMLFKSRCEACGVKEDECPLYSNARGDTLCQDCIPSGHHLITDDDLEVEVIEKNVMFH